MTTVSNNAIQRTIIYLRCKKVNGLFLFIILVVLTSIILLIFLPLYNYDKHVYIKYSNKLNLLQYEKIIRLKRDSNELFTENSQLNNISVITLKNTSIKLNSIIKKQKLVYRFSNRSCQTCVENDLKILRTLADTIGIDNIIILGNFDNIKNLIIYIKNEEIPFDCYNYSDVLNLPIEKNSINDSPCFFVLSNNLKVDFAHTSSPNYSINSLYFKRIRMFLRK
ncbi:MAG: hypothetical protein M0Q53_14850 [Prolixibacteraceae bacterium]|jgi:hypothetical protein|nr:hypothetical protein [Prolixibacteraceae bacterium]